MVTMTQLSLFDNLQIVRKSDPHPSLIAAVEIEPQLSGRRAEFVRCLKAIGKPSTANEIAAMADGMIRESVRKRAAECVRLGFVKEVGDRPCEVTGKLATVYWAV